MSKNKQLKNEEKLQKLTEVTNLLRSAGALFDTVDIDVYKQRLDGFSLNELYNEAFRVGLKGGVDRTNCTRAILEVFVDYCRKVAPNYGNVGEKVSISDEKKRKVLDLMKDAR